MNNDANDAAIVYAYTFVKSKYITLRCNFNLLKQCATLFIYSEDKTSGVPVVVSRANVADDRCKLAVMSLVSVSAHVG